MKKIKIDTKNTAIISGAFFDNKKSECGIIMIPGFTTHKSALYKMAEKLSDDFKVWVFDLNAHGESTGKFDLHQMTESFGAISRTLKKQYNLKQLGLFGQSIGGMVAFMIEKEQPIFDAFCITGTPVNLEKMSKKYSLFKKTPDKAFRIAMILLDKIFSITNKDYKNKTHQMFKTKEGYNEYVYMGALKVKSTKEIFKAMKQAPTLDVLAPSINGPILFVYGEKDKVNNFEKDTIPEDIQYTYRRIKSKDKTMKVVRGANHDINKKTTTDCDWNKDEQYKHIKETIVKYFKDKLLC